MFSVTNPATGLVEREYAVESDAAIEAKLTTAHGRYTEWDVTHRAQRADKLRRVADLQLARIEELATIVAREVGKPMREAREEVSLSSTIYRYYADHGPDFVAEVPLSPQAGGNAVIRTEPIGLVLGVMPWNFPYYQLARFAAPNLIIGNGVLFKPAPQCPESAFAIHDIFVEAGFAEGEFVTMLADNDQIAGMIADTRIAGVSLTGSERAGAAVAEAAGRNIKKVVLELGGSDPFIVLDTDDLEATVNAAVGARTYNAGQMCNAAKRMYVADGLYEEFVTAFTESIRSLKIGDPQDASVQLGPMSSEAAAHTLIGQIDDAVGKGATLLTGGARLDRPGVFVEPAVLIDVVEGMRAYQEELFGPAAVIYRVKDADEAVELANNSPYGLGGAVYSTDLDVARDVANRLDTGMVWINSPQGTMADLPFGGTKRSGFGRELGELGIAEFANKKLIYIPAN